MDDTDKYIMMCGEAEEIQKNMPQYSTADRLVNIPVYDLRGNCWFQRNNEKNIWIPRQDQLQEMAWAKEYSEDNIDHLLMRFYTEIHKTPDGDWQYWDRFRTMEQKWLAFVMKTRYNKVWINDKWREEK